MRLPPSFGSPRRLLLMLVIASAMGCTTREDSATRVGREAARAAESACGDAGQSEACRDPICRDLCGRFADSAHLAETCMDRCLGRGTCNSDADCGRGFVCVVIAPRVRRCAPPPVVAP